MSIASFRAVERVSRETYAPHPSHYLLQQEFYTMAFPLIVGVCFHLQWCFEMGQGPAVSLCSMAQDKSLWGRPVFWYIEIISEYFK
jgi:hypothetical protein